MGYQQGLPLVCGISGQIGWSRATGRLFGVDFLFACLCFGDAVLKQGCRQGTDRDSTGYRLWGVINRVCKQLSTLYQCYQQAFNRLSNRFSTQCVYNMLLCFKLLRSYQHFLWVIIVFITCFWRVLLLRLNSGIIVEKCGDVGVEKWIKLCIRSVSYRDW